MQTDSSQTFSVIVGASSAIAQSIIGLLIQRGEHIIAFTRDSERLVEDPHIRYIECDYQQQSIEHAVDQLSFLKGRIKRVIICNGVLHGDAFFPEKAVKEFELAQYQQIMQINSAIPMLWLSRLLPLLKGKLDCHVVVFSARIGSIGDNLLGGWYSYRASKAALNMLLKSLAVECARSVKNVKLIAFHPGTTDTPLSKPFQQRVPKDKLFSPSFVAKQLIDYLSTTPVDGKLDYVDWEHKPITW